MASLEDLNRLQIEEMNKHKWVSSENAKTDLGQSACLDWIKKYAKPFREWFEKTYGPIN